MPNAADVIWFKEQFAQEIAGAVLGTPFTVDMLTAVACQESGELWPVLRTKNLAQPEILRLCVGDTLDSDRGRRAFPVSKTALLGKPNGAAMFGIARDALQAMAKHIPGYRAVARNPNKFCHGFGIFQFDLQHFLSDPEFFLQQRYADFGACLEKCIAELRAAMHRMGWQQKTSLNDFDTACVAIAYNAGSFKPNKGLKQGYFNGTQYYGQAFFDYLRLAQSVVWDGGRYVHRASPSGHALIAAPTPVETGGSYFIVDTREGLLNVRSAPVVDKRNRNSNVVARLPDGHPVRALRSRKSKGFLEIETSLLGAYHRGYVAADYLKRASEISAIPSIMPTPPSPAAPPRGLIEAHMPHKAGRLTRRTENAGAHSLNEAKQPGRDGNSPEELRTQLAAIIQWLAVDDRRHLRYQPRNRLTFCNIYAHDYCHLAGVYLPRVWWTPPAVSALLQGQTVTPLYGKTIEEMRANDLFRWLRDFGPDFGWRQTGTLTKLQTEVNQGAIGLIVARRKEDGLSGHIVMVAPETDANSARRNADGEVVAALQSQAGTVNFRHGTGRLNWWLDTQFADSAFWLHA